MYSKSCFRQAFSNSHQSSTVLHNLDPVSHSPEGFSEEEFGRADEEVGFDELVLSLIPKESSRLPKFLNSAMREAPKSSSPNPFSWLLPNVLMVEGVVVGGA